MKDLALADSEPAIRVPTPSQTPGIAQRFSDFTSLCEALDYAAQGQAGINFYSSRGDLDAVFPYAQVKAQAQEAARYILNYDVKRGDRIGIVADTSIEFIVMFFAAQYAGLIAVPLPVVTGLGGRQGYEAQLKRVIHSAKPKLVLGPEHLQESLESACQDESVDFVGPWDVLYQGQKSEPPLSPLGADEPSHIQYSSGSTRNPLGILISQKALMANAYSVAKDGLKFREGDRVASWLPFYHDMGLIGFLLIPVTSQLSIDLIHTDSFARRPLKWLEMISKNKCSLAFSPSFGYEICTRRGAGKDDLDLDLSSWRAAGIGGEMVQPAVMDQFSETFSKYGFKKEAFVPSYGLAEMTLAFSFSPLQQGVLCDSIDKAALDADGFAKPVDDNTPLEQTRVFAKCGYPMSGYKVEIRGEDGRILGERYEGSVYINGPALMAGYYEAAEATAEAISVDGWLNTGDRGYMIDGALVITGRQKDLMIVNGRNIWPQDLEWHAEAHVEALRARDTAAFSVEDNGKEKVVILAHCRSQGMDKIKTLRKQIQSVITVHSGIECKVVLIAPGSLPYTTSGKLSRARAKKDYLSGALQDVLEQLSQAQ